MKNILILLFLLLNMEILYSQDFRTEQMKNVRVKKAFEEKKDYLEKVLKTKGFFDFKNDILLLAYKNEQILEVWIKNKSVKKYQFLLQYEFCATSGVLGPKRREGDLQIPEGVYYINYFHPTSAYHLGLKINYPNESDKFFADKKYPGSNILIHGDCCTIGCIPITDDKIKELYILCLEAKASGQAKIPVYIFPTKLNDNNFVLLKTQFQHDTKKMEFWNYLKPIYQYFEQKNELPILKIGINGYFEIQY